MHVCMCACVRACTSAHVCVFVFTPVGSVMFAPNYLQHKSTVGALPWQPAVGRVLVMVVGETARAISLTFKGLGIYFSSSTMNINVSF